MLLRASSKILKRCFSSYPKVMYDSWKNDPTSVHPSWNEYFQKNNINPTGISQTETNDPKIDK